MKIYHIAFTLFLLAAVALPCRSADADTDYKRLEDKAARFFNNKEWASANAMYILMLEKRPDVTSTYSHAAVTNMMMGDTAVAVAMVPRAMDHEVPLDSLLEGIRTTSFSVGRGDLYRNYLVDIRAHYPWLSRVADNYLMRYYAFRQNGPELVAYATRMLEGLPDNLIFLRMLAQGYLLCGETQQATETWLKAAALYPDNYDTALDLANCYQAQNDTVQSRKWFRRAQALRPTPYVTDKAEK